MEILPPRPKIKLELKYEPYVEPPKRRCVICGGLRKHWHFIADSAPVCIFCGDAFRGVYRCKWRNPLEMDYRDHQQMHVISVLCAALEGKNARTI